MITRRAAELESSVNGDLLEYDERQLQEQQCTMNFYTFRNLLESP
jgi:hypothetical protein